MGKPLYRPLWLHNIATNDDGNGGGVRSLDDESIDELCARINFG
jgi:hypothetical protein